jgi:hypothetical protein
MVSFNLYKKINLEYFLGLDYAKTEEQLVAQKNIVMAAVGLGRTGPIFFFS